MARNNFDGITIEDIVERTTTIYSLPQVYERLNETINHPRSSVTDIARVISEDQGLTARLLKLANSPLFGALSSVDSITRAITVIGTRQLRELALAASVKGVFGNIPEDVINMTSFWKHSVACGIVARSIATCRRESNLERFFVSGMLHDVGLLVMCTAIPEAIKEMFQICRNEDKLFFAVEQTCLGFGHEAVGAALLSKWKIPVNIAESAAHHHHPRGAKQFPLEAAVIHLADIICQSMELGFDSECFLPPLDNQAWERIDIPVSILATVIKQSEMQMQETFAILTGGT